jgi:molybdopterin molybdotransferase
MIAFAEARQHVIAACTKMAIETVSTSAALGRIIAEDIYSPDNLPGFDNSAMDGFALRGHGNTIASGREFVVSGALAAGDAATNITEGACEIMTGAPVPNGFDTVVPVENITVMERDEADRPVRIQLLTDVLPHANIRRRGEDVSAGSLILTAGCCIGASERMLLTGLGIAELKVHCRPRVALFSTGRELVDDPHQSLQPGQIRNSNGPFLADRIQQCDAYVCHQETVGDDTDEFLNALNRGLQVGANIVISTGAVSMGRYDFVPDALRSIGANIVFHKVAMRPGKPLLFAVLPNGALYFGLPGNPISSAVGFRFFVQLAIRSMQGIAIEKAIKIPLVHSVNKKVGFTLLQKARVSVDANGQLNVSLLKGQESFRIQPLLNSNAWAVLPEHVSDLADNELIEVYGLQGEGIPLTAILETA